MAKGANSSPTGVQKKRARIPKGDELASNHMVGAVGLEPTILAARDFKSPAYANSATPP